MSQSDVEMEDAEGVPGNDFQEVGSVNPPPDVSVAANVGQDLDAVVHEEKVVNEEKDVTADNGGSEGEIKRSDDEAKLMNEQGAVGEERKAEKQVTARSVVEEQTVVKSDTVEQNTSNAGVTEEKPIENGLEGANHDKDVVKEDASENGVEKKNEEVSKDDGSRVERVAVEEKTKETADGGKDSEETRELVTKLSESKPPLSQNAPTGEVPKSMGEKVEDASNVTENKVIENELKERVKEIALASPVKTAENVAKPNILSHPNQNEAATPSALVRCSPVKTGDHSGQLLKPVFTQATLPLMAEGDDGTPEEQAAFMRELESFHRERAMDFKPPKFYGHPLNCLKLWRAVIRLGGYDRVTGSKLWRQVGESFHPPKTCTTVSWTFRIFYEKSLLEFEKHKRLSGELQLPLLAEAGVDGEGNGFQGSGSGRARRDAAARAMQGWHVQRLFGNGEVGEPIIKDKNLNNVAKREKNLKSIGSLKQKRPNEVDHPVKAARTEPSKQLVTSVVDVGQPADWVKINVRQTKDCFEVYALVPGLLREEVRVQSDPAGRLVITGQPEQSDNPWGITPFKKVVSLPARIDPLQTSAVVSLHGRLFVRVPFEQSSI